MEQNAAGGVIAADVSQLPAPKGEMRRALLMAMGPAREQQDLTSLEHLRVGYMRLADFQPGVGPDPMRSYLHQHPPSWAETDPPDYERIKPYAEAFSQAYEVEKPWRRRVMEEMHVLLAELDPGRLWAVTIHRSWEGRGGSVMPQGRYHCDACGWGRHPTSLMIPLEGCYGHSGSVRSAQQKCIRWS
jgi:hypothetical protein